jgi:hypothetical protein
MSDAYINARDSIVGKKDFIKKHYSTREEALAVLAAIDARKFKLGANQLEKRILKLSKDSEEIYERFIQGEYIQVTQSGNYFLDIATAEADAYEANRFKAPLSQKEFVKLKKNVDTLSYDQMLELAKQLAKNSVFSSLWRNLK